MTNEEEIANKSTPQVLASKTFSQRIGDRLDVICAVAVCLAFSLGLIWFAVCYDGGILLTTFVISGITAAICGWILGILWTPYNATETTVFSQFSKIVYSFISGYLLSKMDKLFATIFDFKEIKDINTDAVFVVLFALSSFLLSVCTTYVCRSYWHSLRSINVKDTDPLPDDRALPPRQEAVL